MPLIEGYSKSTMKKNYKELMGGKMGTTRKKAVDTIAKTRDVSKEEARKIQAGAIARKMQERAAGKKGDKAMKGELRFRTR